MIWSANLLLPNGYVVDELVKTKTTLFLSWITFSFFSGDGKSSLSADQIARFEKKCKEEFTGFGFLLCKRVHFNRSYAQGNLPISLGNVLLLPRVLLTAVAIKRPRSKRLLNKKPGVGLSFCRFFLAVRVVKGAVDLQRVGRLSGAQCQHAVLLAHVEKRRHGAGHKQQRRKELQVVAERVLVAEADQRRRQVEKVGQKEEVGTEHAVRVDVVGVARARRVGQLQRRLEVAARQTVQMAAGDVDCGREHPEARRDEVPHAGSLPRVGLGVVRVVGDREIGHGAEKEERVAEQIPVDAQRQPQAAGGAVLLSPEVLAVDAALALLVHVPPASKAEKTVDQIKNRAKDLHAAAIVAAVPAFQRRNDPKNGSHNETDIAPDKWNKWR